MANGGLEPLSNLASTWWVRERACISGLPAMDGDTCSRAMDFLLECEEKPAKTVFFSPAELLDFSSDLILS